MADSSSATSDNQNKEKEIVVPKDMHRVIFGESHSIQITTFRLNGRKLGYLNGERPKPDIDDPRYAIWDAENSMVMTWLVNSMEEDISSNYMCYSTTKKIWDSLIETYSGHGNKSQIYELTLQAREIRQGGLKEELDEVRGRIIGRATLPSLGEVFAEVIREETRRSVMMGKI
ncbi:hypothetical protein KIW84_021561 [Lathyrus oleraceus]|uniref:Retrotransposon Copia-like N-terminal domain-containing protein n=1 Tax=Pisum sativum TaxID=3888 RepID=A0A9D4YCQ4_PEA|nr:hypothetical protein KIW84_021561 [Pisum sativum]